MAKQSLLYSDAFEQLKQIVGEMEDGNIGVDELLEKVKTAADLIKICKEKLKSTEADVSKILKDLDEANPEAT